MSTVPRLFSMARIVLLVGIACSVGIARQAAAQPASSPSSMALRFSTYLGGSGTETGIALATDSEGNLYVAGVTTSPDFPVRNPAFAYQGGTFAGTDVFIVKLCRVIFSVLVTRQPKPLSIERLTT